jgi:hypothetical protein
MKLSTLGRGLDIPFHPFIYSVFPVISLYATNLGKGYLGEAIAIAAGLVVLVTLLWLLLNLLTKQASSSAIILSAFLVLFFSLGHVISAVGSILEKSPLAERTQFLFKGEISLAIWLTIGAILLFIISRYVIKRTGKLDTATRFLNIAALTLFVISGLNLGFNGLRFYVIPQFRAMMETSDTETTSQGREESTVDDMETSADSTIVQAPDESHGVGEFISSWQQDLPTDGVAVTSDMPDIYYIIVDAYARQDVLQSIFGYDNSEFINYLGDNGFYVANHSSSNYPQTALSLASTLNMIYLDDAISQIGTHTSDRLPLATMIKQSKVFRLLRNSGYQLVAFDSGYDPTRITEADVYLSPPSWSPSPFQEAFVMLTPLSVFRRTVADFRRERTLYAFDHVPDAVKNEEPTFVFAHITVPHFPFIFDKDGNPIEPSKGMGGREDYEYDEYIDGYTEQLAFASDKVISVIDAILSQSPEPPIIIVQSDHGPAAQLAPGWNVSESNVKERLSILNAYYFPDQDYASLYDGITPVNTFRVIFNQFYGCDYDLLDDRAYFSSWNHPYDLTEVTSEVRGEK